MRGEPATRGVSAVGQPRELHGDAPGAQVETPATEKRPRGGVHSKRGEPATRGSAPSVSHANYTATRQADKLKPQRSNASESPQREVNQPTAA